jgi:hypothetical protein
VDRGQSTLFPECIDEDNPVQAPDLALIPISPGAHHLA